MARGKLEPSSTQAQAASKGCWPHTGLGRCPSGKDGKLRLQQLMACTALRIVQRLKI